MFRTASRVLADALKKIHGVELVLNKEADSELTAQMPRTSLRERLPHLFPEVLSIFSSDLHGRISALREATSVTSVADPDSWLLFDRVSPAARTRSRSPPFHMGACANCELAVRQHAKVTAKLEHEHKEETSGLNREKEQLRSELARSVRQVQELGASATAAQQRVAALEQEQKGWEEQTEAAQQVRNG